MATGTKLTITKTRSDNGLDTRVTLLERDRELFNNYFSKMDATLDKIGDSIQAITKLVTLHEERIEVHQKDDDHFHQKIEDRIKESNQELAESIKATKEEFKEDIQAEIKTVLETLKVRVRLGKLEAFKYATVALVSALGYFVAPLLQALWQKWVKH